MNRLKRWRPLWIFLAVSALSLGAGALVKPKDPPLDMLCSGRIGQALTSGEQIQWLLSDYVLDLRGDGQGNFRTSSRLLNAANQQVQGYLHRSASFSHIREGRRLLVHVKHSGRGGADNLQGQQLAGLDMFIFTQQSDITYRVRRLDSRSVLISTGRGGVLLCKPPPAPL